MSSGFYTEQEIEEARKKRQEEWEKVRKPDDPLEAPEQPYETRSLYERLQEQKQKKDLEYEEAHKLKNMVKGLDDDEVDFLELVDRSKMAAERIKHFEEEQELNDYRSRVANLQEKSYDQRLQAELKVNKTKPISNYKSQSKLLQGIVLTKNQPKKRKISETEEKLQGYKIQVVSSTTGNETDIGDSSNSAIKIIENRQGNNSASLESVNSSTKSALTCVGILPGLGFYQGSSSDDCSSDSDQDVTVNDNIKLDLLGRKIVKKDKET